MGARYHLTASLKPPNARHKRKTDPLHLSTILCRYPIPLSISKSKLLLDQIPLFQDTQQLKKSPSYPIHLKLISDNKVSLLLLVGAPQFRTSTSRDEMVGWINLDRTMDQDNPEISPPRPRCALSIFQQMPLRHPGKIEPPQIVTVFPCHFLLPLLPFINKTAV